MQSLQAANLFSVDFSGHIPKLVNLVADNMSLSSWFFPFPDTLEVSLPNLLCKELAYQIEQKFGMETLSATQVERKVLLKTLTG